MTPLSEFDVRQELEQIQAAASAPMRKTRCFLDLSRRIRKAIAALDAAGNDAANGPLRRTLHRLDDEVRVQAVRTLRATRRFRLGFDYGPQVSTKSIWGK